MQTRHTFCFGRDSSAVEQDRSAKTMAKGYKSKCLNKSISLKKPNEFNQFYAENKT